MKPTNTLCKHCQKGKKTNTRFKSKEYSMTRALEIVHTDLVGPNTTKGFKGMGKKCNSPLLGHLNRMELLKERTRQYRKWLEQCLWIPN
jgi:hypothetical protein